MHVRYLHRTLRNGLTPPLPTIANTRAETSLIVSDRELIWCLLEPWKHNAVHCILRSASVTMCLLPRSVSGLRFSRALQG